MTATPRQVVVIGAGISGLTAAHVLLRDEPGIDLTVLEADSRAGGKIATEPFEGRALDCAADAFLARVPEAVALCAELGLEADLVAPASRRAYLFSRGELRPFPEKLSLGVPTDLDALAASGVVSADGVARAAEDLDMREPATAGDESVGGLVRRRVGDEVYETLVAPLLSGVYAGDADNLSVTIAAPQFAVALREHGSLIRGLGAQLAAATKNDAPVFYGLRGGTQTLTDRLAARIEERGGRIRFGTTVTRLARADARLRIDLSDDSPPTDADAVVIATPDFVTANLLRDPVPEVADELASVPYASVALLAFAFRAADIPIPLDGTGFLVPEREGLFLTACTWASTKWAHLDDDPCLLRASVGRITDRRAMTMSDDEVAARVLDDLGTTMGIRAAPQAVRVSRWPDALPQFAPGHLDRVLVWQTTLEHQLPGVALAGAGIGGLGIPACIRRGTAAVGQLRAAGCV